MEKKDNIFEENKDTKKEVIEPVVTMENFQNLMTQTQLITKELEKVKKENISIKESINKSGAITKQELETLAAQIQKKALTFVNREKEKRDVLIKMTTEQKKKKYGVMSITIPEKARGLVQVKKQLGGGKSKQVEGLFVGVGIFNEFVTVGTHDVLKPIGERINEMMSTQTKWKTNIDYFRLDNNKTSPQLN